MYSLRAILEKEPVAIASALRSVLFIGVLAGLFLMDEKLLAGIALAAELVLNLFVRNATTPTATATVNEAQAYAQGSEDAAPSAAYGPPS